MNKFIAIVALLATLACYGCAVSNETLQEQARSNAAVAQSLASAADADSRAVVAQSNADSMRALAEASRPDNTPLILMIVGLFVLVGLFVYWQGRAVVAMAQGPQQQIRALPAQQRQALPQVNYIQIPDQVQRYASSKGGAAVWDEQQACWVIMADDGRVLARERKRLTG